MAAIIYSCLASLLITFSLTTTPSANVVNATSQRSAKLLYRQQCSKCHGPDGRALTSKGKFSHARDLADAKWQDEVTDERIFNSIMNGRSVRGNMPSFGDRFSEAEINALVKFVRDLKK
jgi:cytochrome c6